MRILSIAGQNIASLADPFHIDFTAGPLHGAGLFAITGETGAGKSSILDAMCLALYGDAPRLAGGAAADEVPDPSGAQIKAKDPRAMLRRGAIHGWAEVAFTALDGQDYSARWEARRARDKADGRLQAVSRTLTRAQDGQVIAGQTSLVAEQIQHLTGLSYDEFRRTVLLAQGDFDAFLRADTNDRAGLLEKVTGTGLYRAISARVFERTGEARGVHDALVLRQAEHKLLTPEERAGLEEERAQIATANSAATAERKTLTAALDRHRAHKAAVLQLDAARAQEQAAALAIERAAEDQELLTSIDRAEPLRLPWQAVRDAQARLSETTTAAQEAARSAQDADASAKALEEDARLSEEAYTQSEETFKALGRTWDKAADLDAQITTAAGELAHADDEAKSKAEVSAGLQTTLRALEGEARSASADQKTADAARSALGPALALADHWKQTRCDLEEHATAFAARRAEQEREADTAGQLGTASKALDAMKIADTEDEKAEVQLAKQSSALGTQIDALEAAHPPGHGDALGVLIGHLTGLLRACTDHTQAGEALQKATAAQTEAAQTATSAKEQGDAAALSLQQAEAQIKALQAPAEQADLALSEQARALRLRLEAGAPCPVCGATDHPVALDAALNALATTLRQSLDTARDAAQKARQRQTQAHGLHAAATARAVQAGESIDEAQARQVAALTSWEAEHFAARAQPDCPDLPESPVGSADALGQVHALVTTRQRAAQQTAQQIADLRKALAQTTAAREDLRTAVTTRTAERERLAEQAAELRQRQALSDQQIRSLTALVNKLARSLHPVLEAVGEPLSVLETDSHLAARLESLCASVTYARAQLAKATERCDALAAQMAIAAPRAENAAQSAQQAQQIRDKRQATFQSLREERASLLDGEDTKTHRTWFNEARKAAQDARDTARKKSADSTQASTGAAATAKAAATARAAALTALENAQANLDRSVAESGFEAEALSALFATSRTQVETLRAGLRRLADAVTAAGSTARARQADLDAVLEAGLPEATAPVLSAALEVLEAQTTARQERTGTLAGALLRDDETRANLAGLAAQTASAKAEMEVWQAVNAAVGSKSGDRFARIAQSITLDVLVDRANAHLSDLNPRYLLRRAADLALQVEDRDMGHEARATRSLSGGERFLVSLALALALSRMGNRGGLAATLFIDEGFGSLDAASLDLAIDALETLQSQGRQVGVISHVEAMKDRIPVRINVRKQGGGKSAVSVTGGLA